MNSPHNVSIAVINEDQQHLIKECSITHRCGISISVLNIGGVISKLCVPDRDGVTRDIVLGYHSYMDYIDNNYFIGCIVGRYCNRIQHGQFSVDGVDYKLDRNLGDHHLHGGNDAFHNRYWQMHPIVNDDEVGVTLSLHSPDRDQGYPGDLSVTVTYLLTATGSLQIAYNASTNKKTPIGLTQHTYFNLNGVHSKISNHDLQIFTDDILEVDTDLIPTGKITKVDTEFDFTTKRNIGQMLSNGKVKMRHTKGYDHCYSFRQNTDRKLNLMAQLSSKDTGIVINMHSTECGLQLYTGNHLSSVAGKNNHTYNQYDGLCLEAQPYPDSPNKPEFPNVILQPGETYQSLTELVFSTDNSVDNFS